MILDQQTARIGPLKIAQWIPAYNSQVSSHIVTQVLRDQVSVLRAGHTHGFWSSHSCDLVSLRNEALHRAVLDGWDYQLMQDADVFSDCPDGPLMRLLGTAMETGATVTGACVTLRTRPLRANVWPVRVGQVYEAEKIGTGMVLINLAKVREWYRDYKGPCFARRYFMECGPDATGGGPVVDRNRMIRPEIGMDIWFSKIVRAHGQTVWCDARIPTTHVDGLYRHDYDGKTIPDLAGNQGTDRADLGNTGPTGD